MKSRKRHDRSSDTQDRILDAAEGLLAERGIDAASMRAVTAAAKVNLAAVNYHFGSKEGLIVAVYARRLGPVNEERLAQLVQCQQACAPEAPTPEAVLTAYVAPLVRLMRDPQRGSVFVRLLGRALYEPGAFLQQLFAEELEPVLERFTTVLRRSLPHLGEEELFWRMHFAGGALAYTLAQGPRLALGEGSAPCAGEGVEALVKRLVDFTAAGLRGLSPSPLTVEAEAHALVRSRVASTSTRAKYRR